MAFRVSKTLLARTYARPEFSRLRWRNVPKFYCGCEPYEQVDTCSRYSGLLMLYLFSKRAVDVQVDEKIEISQRCRYS